MPGLLDGVRVVDLTNVLAGPIATYQLALLGAEVIKIETPGAGDLARRLGADPSLNERGMGASFLAQNAAKRSLTLEYHAHAPHPPGTGLQADAAWGIQPPPRSRRSSRLRRAVKHEIPDPNAG